MSALEFEYKTQGDFRIDMHWLSAMALNFGTIKEIEKQPMLIGNQTVSVGDCFKVKGDARSARLHLKGADDKMDYVGHALPKGIELHVEGDCGHFSGAELQGGKLVCRGNVRDFTGCAMTKGMIEVHGECGDFTGSANTGEQRGMSGGTILIRGNAGQHTGDLMRRGTILVQGNMGDYTASRMIAGTISGLGDVGNHVGRGMKRGTLLLPSLPNHKIPVNFTDAGRHNLGYLTLLLHEMRRHDSKFRTIHHMRRRIHRYIGDRSCSGLGELLIWVGGLHQE